MAGQPRRKAFYAKVKKQGGDHIILDRIASGETIKAIAKTYGFKSRRPVYDWLHENPEREKAWAIAKHQSADSLVEDALEILDDPHSAITSSTATMAGQRANFRRYLAGVRDRDQYGEKAGIEVNLNIGDLHLNALRAAGGMGDRAIEPPVETEQIEEAEILAIEGEDDRDTTGADMETTLDP